MASVILLKAEDNVLIACRELAPYEQLSVGDESVVVQQPTPVGFKLARFALKKGTLIIKYGVPIGECMSDVEAGEMVHTHNLHSRYIPSHQRGGYAHG